MTAAIWVLCGFLANLLIGAVCMVCIDTDDQQMYHWYKDCPNEIAWIARPLFLTAWPVVLYLWWRWKRGNPVAWKE